MLSTSPRSRALVTRRDFLWRISRYGGAAVMGSMLALDLLGKEDRFHLDLSGRAPKGKRNRVVILGGGVGGLSAAYELGKLGYTCTVIEARSRPGGRCWTVRGGTEETEIGNPRQVCGFAEGQFYNAGPMRIPYHHTTTLGYCREFGIPLTVFTNFNEGAYIVRRGFPKRRIGAVIADMSGYTSELLAKAVKKNALDLPLSAEDREKFIEYLRGEGRLDASLVYPRDGDPMLDKQEYAHARGYTVSPGALGGPGELTAPLDLEALVKAGYANSLGFLKDYNQQPTMLTPVGGMDRIPRAFAEKLGDAVHFNSPVREIRRTAAGGVRVAFADGRLGGAVRELEADFCICALPPHLMSRLPNDFAAATKSALGLLQPAPAGKIGLQFKRRFWEEDDDIYGGSSKTDDLIGQVYYPFDGYGEKGRGTMIGYYHFGDAKAVLDDQTPAERERIAIEQGARIHPQYPAEFENSFSVAWHRVPHSEAAWALWKDNADFERGHQVLGAADGPFYFAGDWVSNLVGWQAGAFQAAHRAVQALHLRAQAG